MQIPHIKHVITKKRLLIAAACVVVLGGLAAGGWWYFSQQATDKYKMEVAGSNANIQKGLDATADSFKALAGAPDKAKRLASLAELSDKLAKQANDLPVLPTLLGVGLTPQQEQQKRAELIRHLKQLSNDAKASHDLLVYQNAVVTNLQEVAGLSGKNADEQKTLADGWARLITNLNTQKPPEAAKNAHQQLVTAVTSVQASLAALPDLYTKKSYAGFDEKKKEVEARLSDVRKLADTFTAINQAQDKHVTRDYSALLNLLK